MPAICIFILSPCYLIFNIKYLDSWLTENSDINVIKSNILSIILFHYYYFCIKAVTAWTALSHSNCSPTFSWSAFYLIVTSIMMWVIIFSYVPLHWSWTSHAAVCQPHEALCLRIFKVPSSRNVFWFSDSALWHYRCQHKPSQVTKCIRCLFRLYIAF